MGYTDSLRTGENQIQDPKIADLYNKLDLIHHGDIWEEGRMKAIFDIALGGTSEYVDIEKWKNPPPKIQNYKPIKKEEDWIGFGVGGIKFNFDKLQKEPTVVLGMNRLFKTRIVFFKDDKEVGKFRIDEKPNPITRTQYQITAPGWL